MDFQLKALGHWSHLYSLSSEWERLWASRLQGKEEKEAHAIRGHVTLLGNKKFCCISNTDITLH